MLGEVWGDTKDNRRGRITAGDVCHGGEAVRNIEAEAGRSVTRHLGIGASQEVRHEEAASPPR
jgi:hypothetical protein